VTQPAAPSVTVTGNVEGSIVIGDNNFVVNTNYGTIINKQATSRVQLRGSAPLPPRKPRRFVGRAREVAQLEVWIAGGEPAYVHGPQGVGKTTLAKQAANGQAAIAAPNGVLFLEGLDEAGKLLGLGDLVQRMFDALFESEPPLKVDLTSARTYLSNTRPLLLLSGASLPAEAFNRLPDLFPAAPILVETAQPPSGEVYQTLALGPLEPDDGLALLADHAGMSLDEKSRPILAEIAGLLENVPAALVTVGNAILGKRLIPDMIAGLLRDVQTSATEPVQVGLERAYRVMMPALSDAERGMLAQAAAAPGLSVDKAWMEQRFGDLRAANAEALGLLASNSPRLRLAPGLRSVAIEGWDADALRQTLYESLADQLNERWLDFEFVETELGNLLGLLDWAAASERHQIASYLARILDPFLTLRGLWDARAGALQHLLDAARALHDQAAEGWALHQLGTHAVGAGGLQQARILFRQARDLRLSLGDAIGAAYSQHNLDMLPPPPPPPGGGTPGGGLARWGRWLFFGGLAVAVLLAAAIGGRALMPSFRPPTETPTATPRPTLTPTRPPTSTATPTPTQTATITPTATATVPPSLDWSLEPVYHDLSDKMVPGCHLQMTVPRVRGTNDPRVAGFNGVVDQFMEEEIRRRAAYSAEHFGTSCDPAAYTAAWSDEYRVTTWPAENYMEIPPMVIYGDSATYTSSDILLSVFISSSYGYGGTAYNYSLNYDLNRGEPLALGDLFLPGSNYVDYLAHLSIDQFTGQEFFCADPNVFAAPKPDNYSTWNLTYYGLRITFNLYDVTPGPCSTAVVIIPYKDLVKILDPNGPLGKEIGQ